MADNSKAVMTDGGARLLADSMAGISKLQFHSMAVGDGIWQEDEDLQKAEALKSQKQEILPSGISKFDENCVIIRGVLTNRELNEGYYAREIGLFAIDELNPDMEPILYSIITYTIADFIAPYNGLLAATMTLEYYATVSNTIDVTINVEDTGTYASAADFVAYRNEIEERLKSVGSTKLPWKVYTSLEELGEDVDTRDIVEIVKAMEGTSLLEFYATEAGRGENGFPKSGWTRILKINDEKNTEPVAYLTMYEEEDTLTTYEAKMNETGYVTSWQTVDKSLTGAYPSLSSMGYSSQEKPETWGEIFDKMSNSSILCLRDADKLVGSLRPDSEDNVYWCMVYGGSVKAVEWYGYNSTSRKLSRYFGYYINGEMIWKKYGNQMLEVITVKSSAWERDERVNLLYQEIAVSTDFYTEGLKPFLQLELDDNDNNKEVYNKRGYFEKIVRVTVKDENTVIIWAIEETSGPFNVTIRV